MGYIKEPKGVDFLIAPTVLTTTDTKAIHNAIADYKQANKNLPDHVLLGVKDALKEVANGQAAPYKNMRDLLVKR